MMKRELIGAVMAATLLATPAAALTLRVTVEGIAPVEAGLVHVALFESAEGFAQRADGIVAARTADADDAAVTVEFADLKAGRYAVTAFHDANANDTFDQALGVIPLEGVALSNNPKLLPVPTFEDIAIDVAVDSEVRMRFRYLGG